MSWRSEDCQKTGEQFEKWNAGRWVDANMTACNAALAVIEYIRGYKFPDGMVLGVLARTYVATLPGHHAPSGDQLEPWARFEPGVAIFVRRTVFSTMHEALKGKIFGGGVRLEIVGVESTDAERDLARDFVADLPIVLDGGKI